MKFCPKCGKKVSVLYNDLCRECSAQSIELFGYSKKDVTMCRNCDTVFDNNKKYKEGSIKESIETVIKQRIKPSGNIEDAHIEVSLNMPRSMKKSDKIKMNAIVSIRATAEGKVKIEEEFELPVTLRFITCERCSKQNTQYFEGILQIRHSSKEKIERVMKLLEKIMESENKRSVFVTDIVEVKGGVDAYVTSQKHIKEIGKRLFDILGGEFKINEQHFSHDHLTSKNIYRVNVLIRLPDFDKGSVITLNDKLIMVKKIKGYQLIGRDLVWDKDVTMNYKDCEIEVIANREDFMQTTVTKVRPQLEVLNPINYESDRVQNAKHLPEMNTGDKIDVFIHKNGIWAVR